MEAIVVSTVVYVHSMYVNLMEPFFYLICEVLEMFTLIKMHDTQIE